MLLYCFPHAGGTGTLYRGWSARLADVAEVRAVSYRSLQTGARSVRDLARNAADRIAAEPGAPALFGHSMGALVAFETARLLGQGVEVVFASGHVAPHRPSPGPDLHGLPDADFWAEIGALGGTPADLLADADLRAATEARLRAEFRAAETYRYTVGAPLNCDVVALAGTSDARAPVSEVAAWRMHTTGAFELAEFEGGHFFVEDRADAVLAALSSRLAAS